jgi:hypothetical protein
MNTTRAVNYGLLTRSPKIAFLSAVTYTFSRYPFDLQHTVIGPQEVFEEAYVPATYQEQWLDVLPPNSRRIEFSVTTLFSWDSEQRLFTGERVYFYL